MREMILLQNQSEELIKLSNNQLHDKMLSLSEKERQIAAELISYIEEVDRRKLYLDFNFGSLFDYLTIGLKYSSGAAMRRISSARLTREIPEVKDKLLKGKLSL